MVEKERDDDDDDDGKEGKRNFRVWQEVGSRESRSTSTPISYLYISINILCSMKWDGEDFQQGKYWGKGRGRGGFFMYLEFNEFFFFFSSPL